MRSTILALATLALACGETFDEPGDEGAGETTSATSGETTGNPSDPTMGTGTTDASATEADATGTTGEVEPCGNGVLDADEDCDDGNDLDGDCCTSICTIPETACGNGCAEPEEFCYDDGEVIDIYVLSGEMESVQIADLDGDGDQDLALASIYKAWVLLNDGTGTAYQAEDYAMGQWPEWIEVGDVDRDGTEDIVVMADFDGGFLTHRLNVGGGAMGDPETVTGGWGWMQFSFALGDVTGDQVPDAVVAMGMAYELVVFPGTGAGFGDPIVQGADPDGGFLQYLGEAAIGDVNGDGHNDVVMGDDTNKGVTTFFGDGNGALTFQERVDIGHAAHTLALGDLDHQNGIDVVVVGPNSLADGAPAQLDVLLNDGAGVLVLDGSIGIDGNIAPRHPELADFDLDGHVDIVTADREAHGITMRLGDGDGSFDASEHSYELGHMPQNVAVGDLNGDGAPDLAVANGEGFDKVSILLSAN